jgi:hypothetical protein
MTTTTTRTSTATTPRLAVTFIHGVETADPAYAVRAIELLRRAFARHSGADPDEALVIRPVYWAPVLQAAEDDLFSRCFGPGHARYVRWLKRQAARVDQGSRLSLLALSGSAMLPRVPFAGSLPWPTLRWVTTEFAGDAIAYQIAGERDHAVYDAIHARVAETLRELSTQAGPGAPLCVLAHSLGSVVASNYFYDLQVEYGRYPRGGPLALGRGPAVAGRVPTQPSGPAGEVPAPRRLVPAATRLALGPSPSPLERGETLTDLITLGSPLALWSLRSRGFHRPLMVPSPGPGGTGPAASVQPAGGGRPTGGWINVYSPYDLVSQPLRPLSEEYRLAVREDIRLNVGPWWAARGPLSHVWYWNDNRVADLAGRALARTWREIAGVPEGAAIAAQTRRAPVRAQRAASTPESPARAARRTTAAGASGTAARAQGTRQAARSTAEVPAATRASATRATASRATTTRGTTARAVTATSTATGTSGVPATRAAGTRAAGARTAKATTARAASTRPATARLAGAADVSAVATPSAARTEVKATASRATKTASTRSTGTRAASTRAAAKGANGTSSAR